MRMEYILIKKDKTKNNKNENFIVLPSSPLMLIEKNFNDVTVNKISNEDEEIFRKK